MRKSPPARLPSPQLLAGVAALLATAADFDDAVFSPATPRGAARRALDHLLAQDAAARACRDRLEQVRAAAGIDSSSAGWPIDALDTLWTLDRFVDQPRAFLEQPRRVDLRSLMGDVELPWRWLLGLAEERFTWTGEPKKVLRGIIKRLREQIAAQPGRGPKRRRRRLDPLG